MASIIYELSDLLDYYTHQDRHVMEVPHRLGSNRTGKAARFVEKEFFIDYFNRISGLETTSTAL